MAWSVSVTTNDSDLIIKETMLVDANLPSAIRHPSSVLQMDTKPSLAEDKNTLPLSVATTEMTCPVLWWHWATRSNAGVREVARGGGEDTMQGQGGEEGEEDRERGAVFDAGGDSKRDRTSSFHRQTEMEPSLEQVKNPWAWGVKEGGREGWRASLGRGQMFQTSSS